MSRPSRFIRSMTPSSSVKMTPSKFNIVCGRPREVACMPNLDRVPNPRPPRVVDARVTTPTLSRREYNGGTARSRDLSVGRDARPPAPPARESSLYLPFGSYADLGCHTKPPSRLLDSLARILCFYSSAVAWKFFGYIKLSPPVHCFLSKTISNMASKPSITSNSKANLLCCPLPGARVILKHQTLQIQSKFEALCDNCFGS
jgi:hypothetical protein